MDTTLISHSNMDDSRFVIQFFVGNRKVFVKNEDGHEKFFVMKPLSRWLEFLTIDSPAIYFGFALFLLIVYGLLRSPGGLFFAVLLLFMGGVYLHFRDTVTAAASAAVTVFYLVFGCTAARREPIHECFHDLIFFRGIAPVAVLIILILVARLCTNVEPSKSPYVQNNNAAPEDIELATHDNVTIDRH